MLESISWREDSQARPCNSLQEYPMTTHLSVHSCACLHQRRQRLADEVDFPVVLWSGRAPARNFPANRYRFRPSSHFLYFAPVRLEGAAIRALGDRLELFWDEPSAGSILWHGEMPSRDAIAEAIAADAAYPMAELPSRLEEAASLPVQDLETLQQQQQLLQRSLTPLQGRDLDLARAIVRLRLTQDEAGIAEIRRAAEVTVAAFAAGMHATPHARTEAQVRAAMEGVLLERDRSTAYPSIVTIGGEILHSDTYTQPIQPGDLLLADVGSESPIGWASDVTRTWPVSGQFSPTQRDLYEVVLAAHDAAIAKVHPGVEYRSVHLEAALVLAEGLVELGILRGRAEDLVERDVHALFFPHGVGHLLGLDVHDMEDLGDLAGYAPGRERDSRFGLCYLRLHRPLEAGMVVTIEPGFYQVPALLEDKQRRDRVAEAIDCEKLTRFADVRGIRIEDDVLVTPTGSEVLTAGLAVHPEAIQSTVAENR